MTTKHTPGPWQAYNAIGGRILKYWQIKSGQGTPIAHVHAVLNSAEEMGNANLMAAAPLLAEALRAALPILADADAQWGSGEDCYREALEMARHALAAAGLVS